MQPTPTPSVARHRRDTPSLLCHLSIGAGAIGGLFVGWSNGIAAGAGGIGIGGLLGWMTWLVTALAAIALFLVATLLDHGERAPLRRTVARQCTWYAGVCMFALAPAIAFVAGRQSTSALLAHFAG